MTIRDPNFDSLGSRYVIPENGTINHLEKKELYQLSRVSRVVNIRIRHLSGLRLFGNGFTQFGGKHEVCYFTKIDEMGN